MKYSLLKKGMIFLIIFLFVGMFLPSALSYKSNENRIIITSTRFSTYQMGLMAKVTLMTGGILILGSLRFQILNMIILSRINFNESD